MNKRGLSPLIATVLILGFTIIGSILVISFVNNVLEKQTEEADEDAQQTATILNYQIQCKNSHDISKVKIDSTSNSDIDFIIQYRDEIRSNNIVQAYGSDTFGGNKSDDVRVTPTINVNGQIKHLGSQSKHRECIQDNSNYALEFDGDRDSNNPDYVEVLNAPDLNINGNELTVSAWIYPINLLAGGDSSYHILSNNRDMANNIDQVGGYSLYLRRDSNPNIQARIWLTNYNSGDDDPGVPTTYNNNQLEVSGTTELQNNIWYHITMVFDGTRITLYLNGVEEGVSTTIPADTIDSSIYDFYIGVLAHNANPSTAYFEFDGKIDEVAVFEKVLDPEEIQEIMYKRPNTNDIGLVEYFNIDEGSGNTIEGVKGSIGSIIDALWSNTE